MRALIRAISFLTILPIGKRRLDIVSEEELADSMSWFPLAGLIPGFLVFALSLLSPSWLPASVVAFISLVVCVVITGGLHLDGLADWADGLSATSRADILRIMKDTHTGAFGVSAISLVLLGKYSAIFEIISSRHGLFALLLAPMIARWTLTLVAVSSPYPRLEGGTGKAFVGQGGWKTIVKATVVILLAALAAAGLMKGMIYILAAGCSAWLIRSHSIARIGGVTGDILGAACELVEVVVLFVAICLE
ncbi:MAG: adenosylcobinamide-GDP ribazoletransferase [Pseudomonadota bacterium]